MHSYEHQRMRFHLPDLIRIELKIEQITYPGALDAGITVTQCTQLEASGMHLLPYITQFPTD